jgi:hypothetical protein
MIVAIFFALGFVAAAATLAQGNDFTIHGGRGVSTDFHAQARTLAILFSFVAVYMASIAVTLLKSRRSSRLLVLAYFPFASSASIAIFMLVLPAPHFADFVGLVIFGVAGTSFVYWYMYRKPNVLAYYRAIPAPGSDSGAA